VLRSLRGFDQPASSLLGYVWGGGGNRRQRVVVGGITQFSVYDPEAGKLVRKTRRGVK
jgi:hypothetical protein